MMPFPTSMISATAPSGTASAQWRLYFPDGSSGTRVALSEVEMFADDLSSTNLCTGGTASASSTYNLNTPASECFNGAACGGDGWFSGSPATGTWLQYTFPTAVTVGAFRVYTVDPLYSSSHPLSITLQRYVGGSWVDTITIAPTLLWMNGDEWVRFASDGTASATYTAQTSIAASSSAYASKGNIITPNIGVTISQVRFYLAPSGTESYKVVVAAVNGSNQITSILGSSSTQSVSSTGDVSFTLSSPVSVSASQRIAVIVVRTDGTATSPARVSFPSSGGTSGGRITWNGCVRYASLNPAVSDSVLFNTSNSVRSSIPHTYHT